MTKQSELNVEEINSEIEDEESTLPNYKILTYPADYTLEVIHTLMKKGDIEFPKFQRKYVWKPFQSVRLIESFLAGLPVPSIFFYRDPNSQKSLVIDGQQRIKSVYHFIDGAFPEDTRGKKATFRLKTLNKKSKWFNKTFSELSEQDQRLFLNRPLRAFIVEQLDPANDTSIYHIFERLNTGGTLLLNQEIRNSICHGKFNELLHNLNTHLEWKKIINKTVADPRQKDIELILRFIALYYNESKYEKPLKDFLTKFMEKNRNPSQEFLDKTKQIFEETCNSIALNLGSRPFNLAQGINPAILDSVMVAFSKHLDEIPENIKERYDKLKSTKEFTDDCRNATTDVKVVRRRFETAEKILFG